MRIHDRLYTWRLEAVAQGVFDNQVSFGTNYRFGKIWTAETANTRGRPQVTQSFHVGDHLIKGLNRVKPWCSTSVPLHFIL
jgi:hypothetical protein